MISALVSLLVTLLIVGIIWWAVNAIVALLPLPAPIAQVVNIIMIVILCLIVVSALVNFLPSVGHFALLR